MIGSSLGGNITQFIGLEYQDQIGCLGVFSSANWLHQEAFNRYIERQKLSPDQRIFIYVGTEEADDTDKTLMAGNIKQAYIDSSLRYYHDLIAGGVHLDNLFLKVQSGAIHSEIPWSENLPDCLRFLQKTGKVRKERICILNILATGVAILTVKCTLTVMVMLGFRLWSLLHQVVVTMNTMILA